jgi:hypothetical protein
MIEDNGVDSSDESSDIRKQSSVRSGRTGRWLKRVVRKIKYTNILCRVNFLVIVV